MIAICWIIPFLNAYSLNDLNNNEYTWEISGCQNQLIRAEPSVKHIVSSSFPIIYAQQMDCTWKIQAPLGKVVEITFPTFHVDFCDSAGVKIYNGPKSEATLAVEHCGLDNPAPFRSSGQMVSVQAYQKQASQGYGTLLMIGFQAVLKNAPARPLSTYHNNYSPQANNPQPAYNHAGLSNLPMRQTDMGVSGLMNQQAEFLNTLSLLAAGNQGLKMVQQQPMLNQRVVPEKRQMIRTTKMPKRIHQKKPKPKPHPKPINIGTNQVKNDTFERLKAKREYERQKEQELLKRKLIIVIVILILIITGNVWFIWYRKSNENKGTEDGKGPQLNNADRNSFTSKAPVLDNEDSLYCSLDEVR